MSQNNLHRNNNIRQSQMKQNNYFNGHQINLQSSRQQEEEFEFEQTL